MRETARVLCQCQGFHAQKLITVSFRRRGGPPEISVALGVPRMPREQGGWPRLGSAERALFSNESRVLCHLCCRSPACEQMDPCVLRCLRCFCRLLLYACLILILMPLTPLGLRSAGVRCRARPHASQTASRMLLAAAQGTKCGSGFAS